MDDDGTLERVAFVADRGHGHDARIPDKTSASVNLTAPLDTFRFPEYESTSATRQIASASVEHAGHIHGATAYRDLGR
jgi:hypothetical protein